MNIVLDTNILFNDWLLRNVNLRVLLQALNKIGATLYIPEVVRTELVTKFGEELADLKRELDQLRPKWERTLRDWPFPTFGDLSVDSEIEQYRNRLEHVFAESGTEFCPYPQVTHEEIVDRLLRRVKPFAKEGKGYRDFLIWKTILNILGKTEDPVVFISKNTSDFGDEEGLGLHSELVRDLLELGHQPSRVHLVKGLDVFVHDVVKPKLEYVETVADLLESGSYPGVDLRSIILTDYNETFRGHAFRSEKLGFRDEYETPILTWMDDVWYLRVVHVMELPSGELLVEVDVRIDCSFEVLIDHRNSWVIDEDNGLVIRNRDWTHNYTRAIKQDDLSCYTMLTLNPETKEVTSITHWIAELDS